jgi:hypothetical protein
MEKYLLYNLVYEKKLMKEYSSETSKSNRVCHPMLYPRFIASKCGSQFW